MTTIQFYNHIETIEKHLYHFSYSLTSNVDEAKDLVQETVYKALKYKSKYNLNTNFKAWVFTIMKNTFINNYKRSKRISNVIEDKELSTLKNATNSNESSSKLEFNEIWSKVNSLDEIYQIPFKMFFEGFKYEEIAEQLNIPIGTVKSRIFLARKKLQEDILLNN